MTQQEQNEREKGMFGETIETMTRMKPSYYDNALYAMAILSDVQEVLHRVASVSRPYPLTDYDQAQLETARQWINKAKYFIDETRQEVRS